MARKSLPFNDQCSSVVSSLYVDSVIDSQSDNRERLNTVGNDALKMSKLETREYEPSCSNSRVLALIATLSETANKTPSATSDDVPHDSLNIQNTLAAEYNFISQRVAKLEQKLEKIEAEKSELENA
uniref:Filament-like plant protein n=1 Tax=Solanum tuberosum TaxID=4113 RepID=M1C4M4_SOLTU